jgi:CRP-like cAMP-binding protein
LLQQQSGVNHLAAQLPPSVQAEAFDLLINRLGIRMSYAPKENIFHESDPAESFYKVISGLVCTSNFLCNGRRQIGGFYLPGDFFGLECSGAHSVSAEAVTNAEVRVIKKSVLVQVANRSVIEHQLLLLTIRELARVQERMLLLIKNAQERVGEFILEMENRTAVGNSIQLPMRRRDIADYLGRSIETVSRILTSLESCAAIDIPALQQIVLRSHSVLRTVMEDQSDGALSNPHKKTARKRSIRRGHSVRTPVRQRVLSEAV